MKSERNAVSDESRLYSLFIEFNRHGTTNLSPGQLAALEQFQPNSETFEKLLETDRELYDQFYNRSVTVNLHTDTVVGHISANLPVIAMDGTIQMIENIGLDPVEGTSRLSALASCINGGVPGAVTPQVRSNDPSKLLQKELRVTEETYMSIAENLTATLNKTINYEVHGKNNDNCLYFADDLFIKSGVIDGIHDIFSIDDHKNIDWALIKFQSSELTENRRLRTLESSLDILLKSDDNHSFSYIRLQLIDTLKKQIEDEKKGPNKKKRQLIFDATQFIMNGKLPQFDACLKPTSSAGELAFNLAVTSRPISSENKVSASRHQLPNFLELPPEEQRWLYHENKDSPFVWKKVSREGEEQCVTTFVLNEDVTDNLLTINCTGIDVNELQSGSKETKDKHPTTEHQLPKPFYSQETLNQSFLDQMRITSVSCGPLISDDVGILLTLASGAVVGVGAGSASGTGLTVTVSVAIEEGMGAALLSGAAFALPVAAIIFAANYYYQRDSKRIAHNLKKKLKKTNEDMRDARSILLTSIIPKHQEYLNGTIGLEELRKHVEQKNSELNEKLKTFDDRKYYAYYHGAKGSSYYYSECHNQIEQMIQHNKKMLQDATKHLEVKNKFSQTQHQPLQARIDRVRELSQRRVLTTFENSELGLLADSILRECISTNNLGDVRLLDSFNHATFGQVVDMPNVAKPQVPEVRCFERKSPFHVYGLGSANKRHKNQMIVSDELNKLSNAYEKLQQQILVPGANLAAVAAEFDSVYNHAVSTLNNINLLLPNHKRHYQSCTHYFKEYLNNTKANVDRIRRTYQECIDINKRRDLIPSSTIHDLQLQSAFNIMRQAMSKLNDGEASADGKDQTFREMYEAAKYAQSLLTNTSQKNDSHDLMVQETESAIERYSKSDGSYSLSEKIGRLLEALYSNDENLAFVLAKQINAENPDTKTRELCESVIRKCNFDLHIATFVDCNRQLKDASLPIDEKQELYRAMAMAAKSAVDADIREADVSTHINETDDNTVLSPYQRIQKMKEELKEIYSEYESVGGRYRILELKNAMYKLLGDRETYASSNKLSELYRHAKRIKKESEQCKDGIVSGDIIESCNAAIQQSYNNHFVIREGIMSTSLQMLNNYTNRWGNTWMQHLSSALSFINSHLPTLLPDLTFLPHAVVLKDAVNWSQSFCRNLLQEAQRYYRSPSSKALLLSSNLLSFMSNYTGINHRSPTFKNVSTAINSVQFATNVLHAAHPSIAINYVLDAATTIYESIFINKSLNHDDKNNSLSEKVFTYLRQSELLQKSILSAWMDADDIVTNPRYHLSKDVLKCIISASFVLVSLNPITFTPLMGNLISTLFKGTTGYYDELAIEAMLNEAQYYEKNKNPEKQAEVMVNLKDRLVRDKYGLEFKRSQSEVIKRAKSLVNEYQAVQYFNEGDLVEFRRQSAFQSNGQSLVLSVTHFPVHMQVNLVLLRLHSHTIEINYLMSHLDTILSEIDLLLRYFGTTKEMTADDKKKIQAEAIKIITPIINKASLAILKNNKVIDFVLANFNAATSSNVMVDPLIDSIKTIQRIIKSYKLADQANFDPNAYYILGLADLLEFNYIELIKHFNDVPKHNRSFIYWFILGCTLAHLRDEVTKVKFKPVFDDMIATCYDKVTTYLSSTKENYYAVEMNKLISLWRSKCGRLTVRTNIDDLDLWLPVVMKANGTIPLVVKGTQCNEDQFKSGFTKLLLIMKNHALKNTATGSDHLRLFGTCNRPAYMQIGKIIDKILYQSMDAYDGLQTIISKASEHKLHKMLTLAKLYSVVLEKKSPSPGRR